MKCSRIRILRLPGCQANGCPISFVSRSRPDVRTGVPRVKITRLEVFAIGDGPDIDPDKGGVEPLACMRVHTDEGLSGLAEVFRVPPGVVRATVGGTDTLFGLLLNGQEVTHPERLWQRVWDALLHTNRRGWEVIILGALDVAVWDIYGRMLKRPVWELLGGVERGPFQTPVGEAV